MKKAYLLLVVVVALFLGAGVLLWKKQAEQVKQNETKKEEIIKEDETGDTSSWKTYRNEEYGFEVKVPKNKIYEIDENNEWPRFFQIVFTDKAELNKSFQIKINPARIDNNEPMNIYLDSSAKSETTIDNRKALVFFLENGYCDGPRLCSPPITAFTVRANSKDYSISFYGFGSQVSKEIIEILSTFHFFNNFVI